MTRGRGLIVPSQEGIRNCNIGRTKLFLENCNLDFLVVSRANLNVECPHFTSQKMQLTLATLVVLASHPLPPDDPLPLCQLLLGVLLRGCVALALTVFNISRSLGRLA